MEKETKIIFISADNSLVIGIAPSQEAKLFLNGILFNLTFDSISNELPIKLTCDSKKRVIDFLERKYSKINEIKRLIKFFQDLSAQSYIFICFYDDQHIEMYDILKMSLSYYNKGETDDTIALKMKEYEANKKDIQKYLDLYPYEIQMIVPDRKLIRGEKDKKKRKCIYCGGNVNDGKTKFKETAHAIPEALGNVKFIQNEECDACNDFFARNAEEDLCNFLIWKRLRYGLKGKKGYPVFQLTHGRYVRFFDYESEEYGTDWGLFEPVKTFVKENKVKVPIIISDCMPESDKNIEICYVKEYVPQHIYKTLVKCVIGLIGNECLSSFERTINWLRYGNEYIELPKVMIAKCKRLILEPELYIFKRKELNDYTIPYCYGELRILDLIFIFIVPFTSKDKENFVAEKECRRFVHLMNIVYKEYAVDDFSSLSPRRIENEFAVCKQII